MCLRVFVDGNNEKYESLKDGAAALGAAYQKVNFLRDLAADYKELGRLYFPGITYETFDNEAKQAVVTDIRNDFAKALPAIRALPESSRKATLMSAVYYQELLSRLERASAETIKKQRIRVPSRRKLTLLVKTVAKGSL